MQTGDTATVQVVCLAHGVPDGECDTMVSALTRVTNLMKGNKPGLVVTDVAESSDNRLAVALKLFIAVDNARASVTMGELAQVQEGAQDCPAEFYQ